MADTSFFTNAHDFTIESGATFTIVQGNQVVKTTQIIHAGEWPAEQHTSEYDEVRLANAAPLSGLRLSVATLSSFARFTANHIEPSLAWCKWLESKD
ncbi:hypothetical protein PQX77_014034 [Marasmius sp. AFHP31]|nr:hypothetical protein PQX77_014034 [Marasmius sp. AFHP31]